MFAGWGWKKPLPPQWRLEGKKENPYLGSLKVTERRRQRRRRLCFWKNNCLFWQPLPPLAKSFHCEMFRDCCPQSHPSYFCLPPQKTRRHTRWHECECTCVFLCVYQCVHKKKKQPNTPAEENRNSCRLGAKKIRATAAVWVWHGSALSFQLWQFGEEVSERNHYTHGTNRVFPIVFCGSCSGFRHKGLPYIPTGKVFAFEALLATDTCSCLRHQSRNKNAKCGIRWVVSWEAALLLPDFGRVALSGPAKFVHLA